MDIHIHYYWRVANYSFGKDWQTFRECVCRNKRQTPYSVHSVRERASVSSVVYILELQGLFSIR
jgi:hypothetical protein